MNCEYDGVYIPNLANTAKQYGIDEYRFAHNYELAGKELTIVAEKEYKLTFQCIHNAVFEGKKLEWEAEKLANDLYFVRFGANLAALDLGKRLITLLLKGKRTPIFGAVKCPCCADEPLPEERHALCGDDMVGTNVRWRFGVNRFVDHDYYAKGKVRAAWSKNTVRAGLTERTFRDSWKPNAEEVIEDTLKAVKLGGPYYLIDVACKVPEGVCASAGMTRLVLLQDYDRMMTVGCAMGPDMEPAMLAGYAEFLN